MSYEALARKWRPKIFGEIIGQDHVVTPLVNAVVDGKIHHAYLFAGTRGVGKTTAARIFARAINCREGTPPDPCNGCDVCGEIIDGISTDVLEIDGASNTGIDDVRRLRETAVYVPSKGRFRVYIIDEVHMLSRQAFNGLLKILEEPPSHLIFIFATTEPYRIPETVLSRMIRFDFRLIPGSRIRDHLKLVCDGEGIGYDEASLSYISHVAAGSIRDGLSILEQCTMTTGGALDYGRVLEILGYPEIAGVSRLGSAVVDGKAKDAIWLLRNLYEGGTDLKNLYTTFLGFFRKVALYIFTKDLSILDDETEGVRNAVTEISGRLKRQESLFLFDVILKSERDILMSEFPLPGFEAMLLRAISFRELLSVSEMIGGGEGLVVAEAVPEEKEKRYGDVEVTSQSVRKVTPGGEKSAPQMVASESSDAVKSEKGLDGDNHWEKFLKSIAMKKKFVLKGLLENMKGGIDGEKFFIRCEFEALLEKLQEPDKWNIIKEAVNEVFGKPVDIILQKDEPTERTEKDSAKEQTDLEKKVLSDPVVIELLKEFPGSRIADIKNIDSEKRSKEEGTSNPEGGFSDEMEMIASHYVREEEEEED